VLIAPVPADMLVGIDDARRDGHDAVSVPGPGRHTIWILPRRAQRAPSTEAKQANDERLGDPSAG
jgi:hypothetical protein